VRFSALEYVALVFTVYRLTRLVVGDSLFEGTRERFANWAFDPKGAYRPVIADDGEVRERLTLVRGKFADLVTCAYCLSVHLSLWVYLVWVLVMNRWAHTPLLEHAIGWMALAGGTCALWRYLEDPEKPS
jgi:Protein of unknown function (DUF1360)